MTRWAAENAEGVVHVLSSANASIASSIPFLRSKRLMERNTMSLDWSNDLGVHYAPVEIQSKECYLKGSSAEDDSRSNVLS